MSSTKNESIKIKFKLNNGQDFYGLVKEVKKSLFASNNQLEVFGISEKVIPTIVIMILDEGILAAIPIKHINQQSILPINVPYTFLIRENRTPISPGLRFDVFNRDNFTCQYCGRSPPEVILEIDHKEAYSLTQNDDISNLITSCRDCNRGKSTKSIGESS